MSWRGGWRGGRYHDACPCIDWYGLDSMEGQSTLFEIHVGIFRLIDWTLNPARDMIRACEGRWTRIDLKSGKSKGFSTFSEMESPRLHARDKSIKSALDTATPKRMPFSLIAKCTRGQIDPFSTRLQRVVCPPAGNHGQGRTEETQRESVCVGASA